MLIDSASRRSPLRCALRDRRVQICLSSTIITAYDAAARTSAYQCSLEGRSNHPIWRTRYVQRVLFDLADKVTLKFLPPKDFNLDFYTEVQDLSHLENLLTSASPRYAALNMAVCSLIEDFALVGFETLAVEDKHSMLHLMHVIDRATGYVYIPPTSSLPPDAMDPGDVGRSQKPNEYALLSTAAGPLTGLRSDIQDVQERWIDAKEEWDAYERREWRKEGEMIREQKVREDAEKNKKTNKIRVRGGQGQSSN